MNINDDGIPLPEVPDEAIAQRRAAVLAALDAMDTIEVESRALRSTEQTMVGRSFGELRRMLTREGSLLAREADRRKRP